jgi:hypothetical protein
MAGSVRAAPRGELVVSALTRLPPPHGGDGAPRAQHRHGGSQLGPCPAVPCCDAVLNVFNSQRNHSPRLDHGPSTTELASVSVGSFLIFSADSWTQGRAGSVYARLQISTPGVTGGATEACRMETGGKGNLERRKKVTGGNSCRIRQAIKERVVVDLVGNWQ